MQTAFLSRALEKSVLLRGLCKGIYTTICTYRWHRRGFILSYTKIALAQRLRLKLDLQLGYPHHKAIVLLHILSTATAITRWHGVNVTGGGPVELRRW